MLDFVLSLRDCADEKADKDTDTDRIFFSLEESTWERGRNDEAYSSVLLKLENSVLYESHEVNPESFGILDKIHGEVLSE